MLVGKLAVRTHYCEAASSSLAGHILNKMFGSIDKFWCCCEETTPLTGFAYCSDATGLILLLRLCLLLLCHSGLLLNVPVSS